MIFSKKHNSLSEELETQEIKTGEDNKKNEEEALSLFEQKEREVLKTLADNPEYSGKHEIRVHMDDGSTIDYEGNDESVAWILANMAQQTNVALIWNKGGSPHCAINMNKAVYIEFNTIKDKEDDNEKVA